MPLRFAASWHGHEFCRTISMPMKQATIILLFLLLRPTAFAQGTAAPRTFALRADVLQHGVALPGLKRSFTPIAPGFRLGVVRHGRSSKRTAWRQQAFVGWYRHPELHDAFLISGELAFRLKLGKFFLGLSGGPGYMLQMPYSPVYTWRNDGYVRSGQVLHRATLHLAAEVGYRLTSRLEAHGRFEELFEYPYGLNATPVLPHRMLSVGIALNLTNH